MAYFRDGKSRDSKRFHWIGGAVACVLLLALASVLLHILCQDLTDKPLAEEGPQFPPSTLSAPRALQESKQHGGQQEQNSTSLSQTPAKISANRQKYLKVALAVACTAIALAGLLTAAALLSRPAVQQQLVPPTSTQQDPQVTTALESAQEKIQQSGVQESPIQKPPAHSLWIVLSSVGTVLLLLSLVAAVVAWRRWGRQKALEDVAAPQEQPAFQQEQLAALQAVRDHVRSRPFRYPRLPTDLSPCTNAPRTHIAYSPDDSLALINIRFIRSKESSLCSSTFVLRGENDRFELVNLIDPRDHCRLGELEKLAQEITALYDRQNQSGDRTPITNAEQIFRL